LAKFEKGVVDQKVEKDMRLDIFKMIANISEPTRELVNRNLLILKIKWMLKTSSVQHNGGKNMRTCFLQLALVLDKS
jgi:hypothetical protein